MPPTGLIFFNLLKSDFKVIRVIYDVIENLKNIVKQNKSSNSRPPAPRATCTHTKL